MSSADPDFAVLMCVSSFSLCIQFDVVQSLVPPRSRSRTISISISNSAPSRTVPASIADVVFVLSSLYMLYGRRWVLGVMVGLRLGGRALGWLWVGSRRATWAMDGRCDVWYWSGSVVWVGHCPFASCAWLARLNGMLDGMGLL